MIVCVTVVSAQLSTIIAYVLYFTRYVTDVIVSRNPLRDHRPLRASFSVFLHQHSQ